MIKKIVIDGFRGFREFSCDLFAPVTVIGGRNNSGKSSLLEALSLTFDFSTAAGLVRLSALRGLKAKSLADFSSFFTNGDMSHAAHVESSLAGGNRRSVTLTYELPLTALTISQPGSPVTVADLKSAVESVSRISARFSVRQESASLPAFEDSAFVLAQGDSDVSFTRIDNAPQPIGEYIAAACRGIADDLMVRLYVSNKFDLIKETIRKIDSRIVDLVPVDSRIMARVTGVDNMLPLASMGDGMVKAVACLARIMSVPKGGVCAFDEIENGLHYSAMQTVWRALVDVARARDVQLVVTTHSLEFLQSVSRVGEEVGSDDFAYLKMTRSQDGKTFTDRFSDDEFRTYIDQEFELR